jgi:hypothetical protein
MAENDTRNLTPETDGPVINDGLADFVLEDTVSSAAPLRAATGAPTADTSLLPEDEPDFENRSPVFKELALPKLPELKRENRAKLLMQSPNKLFFYWSVKSNPFRTLHKAFGERTGNYSLVLKLIDLKHETAEIYPVEAEGSWWFDVEADGSYRAEIGFYAPNGPYVRMMFSNTIETPRKSPSPRAATSADWKVSAETFAEVLDVSGFAQDAFNVAMAGDDHEHSERATRAAFINFIGVGSGVDMQGFSAEDLRFALLALASGISLDELREHLSPALFALLQKYEASLSADRANSALHEHFGISSDEIEEEEQIGPAIFGSSLVNFPRLSIRKRKELPKFEPLSSFSIGSKG